MKRSLIFVFPLIGLAAVVACSDSVDVGSQTTPLPDAAGIDVVTPVIDAAPDTATDASDASTRTVTYLKASNTHADARFGTTIAMDGDTLVVGARGDASGDVTMPTDTSAPNAGAVYVYRRTNGTWAQEAYLKPSTIEAGAFFGISVTLSGNTIVAGAIREANGEGAAYVFTRTGTTWTEKAHLKASNARADAEFGTSVSLSGDTVVVGSVGETSTATGVGGDQSDGAAAHTGAAYVFARTGTTWAQQAYLKASNARAGAYFGSSAALDGDTVVVGSVLESSGAKGVNGNQDTTVPSAGAAYVFTRTSGVWSQQAYLKASNTGTDGNVTGEFSLGLAVSGDTIAVGSPIEASKAKGVGGDQADQSAVNAGAVYVFHRTGTTWTQEAYVKASNTRSLAQFGYSVSLDGPTLAVGSIDESSASTGFDGNQLDTMAANAGAAYVFQKTGNAWAQTHYLKATNPRAEAQFGYSVTVSADSVAVGSIFESSSATGVNGNKDDTSANLSGAAYVYR